MASWARTKVWDEALKEIFRKSPDPKNPGRCKLCDSADNLLRTSRGVLCEPCNAKLVADRLMGNQATIYVGLFTQEHGPGEVTELSGAGYTRQEVPVDIVDGQMRGERLASFKASGYWPEIQGYFFANSEQAEPLVYHRLDAPVQVPAGGMVKVNVGLTIG